MFNRLKRWLFGTPKPGLWGKSWVLTPKQIRDLRCSDEGVRISVICSTTSMDRVDLTYVQLAADRARLERENADLEAKPVDLERQHYTLVHTQNELVQAHRELIRQYSQFLEHYKSLIAPAELSIARLPAASQ